MQQLSTSSHAVRIDISNPRPASESLDDAAILPEESLRLARSLEFPLAEALQLAAEAGEVILAYYNGDAEELVVEQKQDNSPVTSADRASNDILVAGLQHLYPNIPVLSEENEMPAENEQAKWNKYFLVDPLDGTKGFLRHTDHFTVNIALMERDARGMPEPVAGVIYVPVSRAWYWGGALFGSYRQRGVSGAACKLPLQSVSKKYAASEVSQAGSVHQGEGLEESGLEGSDFSEAPPQLADSSIKNAGGSSPAAQVLSRAFSSPPVVLQSDVSKTPRLSAWLGDMEHTRLRAGSSLKFCLLAEGTAQLFPCMHPTWEWDTAAGHAIVGGAGGTLTTIEGNPFEYGKNPPLNGHFLAVLYL